MPEQARVSDIAKCPADGHACPGCKHSVEGPVIAGSPDVMVNGLPAARVGDPGKHASCCGPNTFECDKGSETVRINGKKAHRKGDMTKHCGGMGEMDQGSSDVYTGG